MTSCIGFAGPDLDEAVQVMKLLCYELMDIDKVPALFRILKENMDELVAIMAHKTDEVSHVCCLGFWLACKFVASYTAAQSFPPC